MCSLLRCDEVSWIVNKYWHVCFPFIFVVWIGWVLAWRYLFDGFDDWDADECEFISYGSAFLTWSMDWILFMWIWFFGCTQWCLDMKVGWMEGVSTEFANSLWGPLSSTVYWCVVGDDSIIACTGIILLNGNSLLMNSGGVKNEFVDHSYVCRTLSFSSS